VPKGPVNANLYIENLPSFWGDETLKAIFASFGKIVSATVYKDKQTGLSKGFGKAV
jgi:RNA recognition motif-containing protein